MTIFLYLMLAAGLLLGFAVCVLVGLYFIIAQDNG
jgi:hypothetical protein